LGDNPFPHQPSLNPESDDPRVNGAIYCEELHLDKTKDFRDLLIPTEARRQTRSIAFLMDSASRKGRGIGKSAFLKHQQRELMKDLGDTASDGAAVLFALYLAPAPYPPCRKFWEFSKLAVKAMLDQHVISLAICRMRALSGSIPQDVLEEGEAAGDLQSSVGDSRWLQDRHIRAGDLSDWVLRRLLSGGVSQELAMLLAHAGYSSAELQKQWFSKLGDGFWKTDGGFLLFDGLVRVFEAAEFTKGILLVDEVEQIVMPQNLLERRAFADSLRYYLIDGNCQNARIQFYGLLLTIHPLIQELLLPHWQAAGLDRLAPLNEPDARRCTVYFPHLTEEKAVPLVEVYLERYRRADSDQRGIKPFTKDAVVAALLKSNGLPGRTLSLLHHVVERASARSLREIDRPIVEEVATAAGPSEAQGEQPPPLPPARINLEG
jgi:hypothetical protein